MLPNPRIRVTLHPRKVDKWGIALGHIDCEIGDNERKMVAAAQADATAMVKAAGAKIVTEGGTPSTPGNTIHEMGTARMGRDPRTSVLNKHNQAHDVPNLFITDGASMASCAWQNPSLTFMALSARARTTLWSCCEKATFDRRAQKVAFEPWRAASVLITFTSTVKTRRWADGGNNEVFKIHAPVGARNCARRYLEFNIVRG